LPEYFFNFLPIGREVVGPIGSQAALCDHWSGSYRNGGPLGRKTFTFTYCTVLAEKRTPFLQKYEIFLVA
jgi:hypothetical protein